MGCGGSSIILSEEGIILLYKTTKDKEKVKIINDANLSKVKIYDIEKKCLVKENGYKRRDSKF